MSFAAERSALRGIGLKVAAVTFFIAMAACIKAAQGGGLPAGQAVFGRSFFALPVVLVWLWWHAPSLAGLRAGLATAHPWGHVWRGLVGAGAMLTGFGALGLLPLPQVTAIFYATPVFTVVLAFLFLHEPVRAFRMSAVAVGLLGVGVVAWPDLALSAVSSDEDVAVARFLGATLALVSAFLAGVAQVLIRRLVETEETSAIAFYFQSSAALFGLLTLPLGLIGAEWLEPWRWPSPAQWALLVGAGLFGGVGQIVHTTAYRYADASVIAPFEYSSIVFAILIGYFLFSEVPTVSTLVGTVIVVAAGIFIIWRESRLGVDRSKSRRAKPLHG